MTETIIKIEKLCLNIGGTQILRDVSFEIAAGQRLSIIGANGAGKTTLLKCLDKIIGICDGKITVAGKNLNQYRQKELAKILAYVPQSAYFNAPFSVQEFVMMARFPHLSSFSVVTAEDKKIVAGAMALTEIADFASRALTTLSGGELQRVNIAAAVAQQSKVMLLDEPTTFLDYKHQSDIQILLDKINSEKGTTTVSVTHDINTAVMFSDRIVALKSGRVAFDGRPEEVMDNKILNDIYEKEFLFSNHPQTGQKLLIPHQREI
ncbi:MAG: ABC transporter ATP-binding protein [Anaerohalosphaeraceae bacterium]|nr:ABC transporter ATP-binding protein [Anaerohalosphaeraceae bacterium]